MNSTTLHDAAIVRHSNDHVAAKSTPAILRSGSAPTVPHGRPHRPYWQWLHAYSVPISGYHRPSASCAGRGEIRAYAQPTTFHHHIGEPSIVCVLGQARKAKYGIEKLVLETTSDHWRTDCKTMVPAQIAFGRDRRHLDTW